jgi:acyl-coenzyme A thioesterase PaaI-like protein
LPKGWFIDVNKLRHERDKEYDALNTGERPLRKIRIIENISLDGVTQAPGGPDEDRDGNFEHGGWTMQYFDSAMAEAIAAAQGKSFDLLLG